MLHSMVGVACLGLILFQFSMPSIFALVLSVAASIYIEHWKKMSLAAYMRYVVMMATGRIKSTSNIWMNLINK